MPGMLSTALWAALAAGVDARHAPPSSPYGPRRLDESTNCTSDLVDFDFQLSLDSDLDMYWTADNTTLTALLRYQGTAWVALGVSDSGGLMVGSEVVLGLPNDGTVLKYDLTERSASGVEEAPTVRQTLNGTVLVQSGGVTTMQFSKLLEESGEIAIDGRGENTFVYAYGSGNSLAVHEGRGAVVVDLLTCVSTSVDLQSIREGAVLLHGGLMVLGFSWLMPAGVMAAVFKFFLGNSWIRWHATLQVIAVVCVVAGLILMVLEVDRADGPEHLDNSHARFGAYVAAGAVLQVLVAQCRPARNPRDLESYEGDADWTCREQSLARRIFQWFHKLLGFSLIPAGVLAVRLGATLAEDNGYMSNARARTMWYLSVGPVAVFLVIILLYRVVAFCYCRRAREQRHDGTMGSGLEMRKP